jgi:hypothetical protein
MFWSRFEGFADEIQIQYYTANHFGKGVYEGEVVYAYGYYLDDFGIEDGQWRVQKRQLNYMGPLIGNLSIFT